MGGSSVDGSSKDVIKAFWDDRVSFVKHIIGVVPTDQQGDALHRLDTSDHVTISSGHGCGKSAVEAWAILHYMACRPFPKIPCTAPSKHQLYDVLWAELAKWHRQMREPFRSQFCWTKEKFFHKEHPEEWFAVARTAVKENPEALQGFHADYVFQVLDEASGIPETIFEVASGAHGRVETKELLCGNPTRLSGTFYLSHHEHKNLYAGATWSCLESPIVDSRFAERVRQRYGEDSNVYRVRVLGRFPLREGDAFIPYDLAFEAISREMLPQTGMPKVFGLDVARYGQDESVLAIRQGDEFHPFHVLRGKSTMELTGFVAQMANQEKPVQIFVDVIGIGSGVYDRLEELGFPVCAINVAELPAVDARKYRRLRDELWGLMRDWLETRRGRISDNADLDLVGQLTTPKYRFTSRGGIVIETKDEMRKRGLGSPNVADAHILTFAQPVSSYQKESDAFWNDLYEPVAAYAPMDRETGY